MLGEAAPGRAFASCLAVAAAPAPPRRCGLGAHAYQEGGVWRVIQHNMRAPRGCQRMAMLWRLQGVHPDMMSRLDKGAAPAQQGV